MEVESEWHKLFRVRKTITEMLHDRGYLLTKSDLNMSAQEFKDKYGDHPKREEMIILVQKRDDPTDQCFVFFPDEKKVGIKPIRSYFERMKEEDVQRGVLVVIEGMTAFAKQSLAEMGTRGYHLEHFQEKELLVNITKHVLVPKHVPLTRDEKMKLLEKYKLKEVQLPRIQIHDPVARYLGLKRGEVVKIIRPSETAGRYVTYRLVM
eukprot:GCRY01001739.1.p1 GENE.GCRY01001739.1~~GCRY01001739.1.p1  ORF type:complete len:207 (-),score=16.44 GCRY01001739.1:471-1091(-)